MSFGNVNDPENKTHKKRVSFGNVKLNYLPNNDIDAALSHASAVVYDYDYDYDGPAYFSKNGCGTFKLQIKTKIQNLNFD